MLEVFDVAFPKKRHATLLRDIKRAADALGEARDLDVQIELLETFLERASEEDRTGVAALIQRLRGQRELAYASFEPALDRLERDRIGERVAELTA